VFSIFELKTMALDNGIPGISQTQLMLLFLMIVAIAMIPYSFLYLSLRDKTTSTLRTSPTLEFVVKPLRRILSSMHLHRHPELLHH